MSQPSKKIEEEIIDSLADHICTHMDGTGTVNYEFLRQTLKQYKTALLEEVENEMRKHQTTGFTIIENPLVQLQDMIGILHNHKEQTNTKE